MRPGRAHLWHSRGVIAFPGYFVADTPWAGVKASTGSSLNRDQGSSYLSGGRSYRGTGGGAINDTQDIDHYLASGTFKHALIHSTSSESGIYKCQLDGVTVSTTDGYSVGVVQNVYVEDTGNVVTAGLKVVRFLTDAKNASSSDYGTKLFTSMFARTGS